MPINSKSGELLWWVGVFTYRYGHGMRGLFTRSRPDAHRVLLDCGLKGHFELQQADSGNLGDIHIPADLP